MENMTAAALKAQIKELSAQAKAAREAEKKAARSAQSAEKKAARQMNKAWKEADRENKRRERIEAQLAKKTANANAAEHIKNAVEEVRQLMEKHNIDIKTLRHALRSDAQPSVATAAEDAQPTMDSPVEQAAE